MLRSRSPRWTWAAVGLVVVAGLVVRAFLLTHALGVLDADEATTGLVARHFLYNREHPVFYWSSNYGGTLEAAVTAAVFAVTGASVLVLKAVAVLWYAVACLLLWRVGSRLVNPMVGAVAGLLMWVWPGTFVWWSTKSRGFYGALVVLALIVALCGLRVAERPRRPLDWAVLGSAAGLGWWVGPQIAVLVVPVGMWVLVRNWRAVRLAWMAVPTALLGAAPWLLWNVRRHFDSFHVPPQPASAPYLTRLGRFWTEGLPMALGLRVPYGSAWLKPWAQWVYPVVVVALAVVVVVRYRKTGALLVGTVGLYSVLYAVNPLTVHSADGRYVFLLASVLALVVASAVVVGGRGRPAAPASAASASAAPVASAGVLLAVALVLTGLQLSTIRNGATFYASDGMVPLDLTPLVRVLDSEHVRTAVADYAIAYRVDFETGERIVVAGAPYNRYQPYLDRLAAAAEPPAWIFVQGSTADGHFRQALDARQIRYRMRSAGRLAVYLLEEKYLPGQLPSS